MTAKAPAFYSMSMHELASWVLANNGKNGVEFDCFPGVDELDDDEEKEVREEYESMAEEMWAAAKAA